MNNWLRYKIFNRNFYASEKTLEHIIPNQTARKSKPQIFWKKQIWEKQNKTKYNNIFFLMQVRKQNNKHTFPKNVQKHEKNKKYIIENQIFTIPPTPHYTTHYTTLHYTTPHYTTLHHTTPHHTTPHYTQLHYTTLPYPTLQYITLHYVTLHSLHHHKCNCNYTKLITLHHNYNSTTLQLQLQLLYPTLHPAVVGEVTDQVTTATIATTPEKKNQTTFRSISGFALPSVIHNNRSLLYVSYLWNFRHRLVRYYW